MNTAKSNRPNFKSYIIAMCVVAIPFTVIHELGKIKPNTPASNETPAHIKQQVDQRLSEYSDKYQRILELYSIEYARVLANFTANESVTPMDVQELCADMKFLRSTNPTGFEYFSNLLDSHKEVNRICQL